VNLNAGLNIPRWLGAINLLFSNKRAYYNGVYENLAYPVDYETIELYIQVLLPAYYISLGWEKSRTSIADIPRRSLFD
jgi:hypothetical protein